MILVDGRQTDTLSVNDRGLAYGDGLFETMAVRDGTALHWDRHMQRMADGCTRLGLPMPDPSLWRGEADAVIRATPSCGVLKLMLTRGNGPRGYRVPAVVEPTRLVMGLPPVEWPAAWREVGVDVRLCRMRLGCNPGLAGMKHLNRLEQVLARGEWGDEYQEGLMLDTRDHVVEGTMSNLFLILDDTLCTPLLDQCGVAGITRARVMESARALGIPVVEDCFRLQDVRRAQALFLTGTLIGIWPVRRLEGRVMAVSPMVKRLQRVLDPEIGA